MALVSIVIPAYNHARYLDAAIQSVLAQDADVELIVIDDGSTDDTRAVLAACTGRFHWETQANAGQARTLNRGWAMARGELLGYLSADDLLRPGCVKAALETLAADPGAVLTYCDFDLVDPDSRVVRTVRAPEFDYRAMVTDLACPPGPGAFFRRAAYSRAGGWNAAYRQMPDYEYWLRLGLTGTFRRIPRVLAAFRVHEGSASFSTVAPERAEEPVRILQGYFALPDVPEPIRREQPRALSNALLVAAQLHLRAGRYRAARECASRAARLFPRNLARARVVRQLANGLFNRLGHRLLWWWKRARAGGRP
jgi:glycosyltransferase involved in cell wall biosynthesis